jgi:hypothetical protein
MKRSKRRYTPRSTICRGLVSLASRPEYPPSMPVPDEPTSVAIPDASTCRLPLPERKDERRVIHLGVQTMLPFLRTHLADDHIRCVPNVDAARHLGPFLATEQIEDLMRYIAR